MDSEVKSLTKNEKYLYEVFNLLKKRDGLALSAKETHFSDTELRMIAEILSAKVNGKRLISTQLAKLLGITRSAVSQIVNRLEANGVVKRVADAVDRKIAYIEVTEETLEKYSEDLKICLNFVGMVVEKFGEKKFYEMCALFGEFADTVEKAKKECAKKA